jgi:hypothetical protein
MDNALRLHTRSGGTHHSVTSDVRIRFTSDGSAMLRDDPNIGHGYGHSLRKLVPIPERGNLDGFVPSSSVQRNIHADPSDHHDCDRID